MNKAPHVGIWAAAWLLGGCVVEVASATSPGVAVTGPPPAPMLESRPAPPVPHALWVPGYWHWTGVQYAWIPGHWESGRAGAQWRAPRYFLRDGVYYYEPGGWNTVPAR